MVGAGIEFDNGRYEIGALGINASRVRLITRHFIGDNNVTDFFDRPGHQF